MYNTNVNHVPDVVSSGKYTHYVVIGAGKTGSDAIVKLLRMGVHPSSIKWIISQDVWYLIRDSLFAGKNHYKTGERFLNPMLKKDSMKEVFLEYEKIGIMGRLDPTLPFPTVFKGATMDREELELMKTVKDVVRLGRITSIDVNGVMSFANKEATKLPLSSNSESTVFIDCMAEEFYGYSTFPLDMKIFERNRINLGPVLTVFNPSFSSALISFLEAHIEDDEFKNKSIFFGRVIPTYDDFLNQFYTNLKTVIGLIENYPPIADFFLYSRTNADAPIHNGWVKFIWSQFGPSQGAKKVRKLMEKIESGSFRDVKIDPEMVEREMPGKIVLSRFEKRVIAQKRKALKKENFLTQYPTSKA